MRVTSLMFALLLTSCINSLPRGAERPPNSDDMRVIDATRDAWIAAGQPWGDQCESEHAEIVVIRADQETSVGGYCASLGPCCGTMQKQDSCRCSLRTGGPGCAAGSMTREATIIQPFAALTNSFRPMIWLSAYESSETQRGLIVHEYLHALLACSHQGADAAHTLPPGVWGSAGIEGAGQRTPGAGLVGCLGGRRGRL